MTFSSRISRLQAFRLAVWGNPSALLEQSTRPSGSNLRTFHYLDLGEHHEAVEFICNSLLHQRILVFQEYRDAMNRFKMDYALYGNGACIMGQSGIGNSCFNVYAVIELLRERQPVAVQVFWVTAPHYVVFTAHSVTVHNMRDIDPLRGHDTPIWAFSDLDPTVLDPSMTFQRVRRVRTFLTICPDERDWKDWTEENAVHVYFFEPPSIEEIEDLAFILNKDARRMKALAQKWGRVPRTLLQLFRIPAYEQDIEMDVTDVVSKVVQNPDSVFDALAECNSSMIPGAPISLVFFIKPISKTHRTSHLVYVPNRWLISQLLDGLGRQRENTTRTTFFTAMLRYPQTRLASGWIFEEIVHHSLTRGGNFTFHWHDPFHWFHWYGRGNTQNLRIPFLATYTLLTDLHNPPPFYWRPSTSNFPGIDSAVFLADAVYVIQATIRRRHSTPESGLMELWDSAPQAKRALPWKMVFVGFRDDQAKSVSKPYAKKLKIGEDHLPVGRLTVPLGSFVSKDLESALEADAPTGSDSIGMAVVQEEVV